MHTVTVLHANSSVKAFWHLQFCCIWSENTLSGVVWCVGLLHHQKYLSASAEAEKTKNMLQYRRAIGNTLPRRCIKHGSNHFNFSRKDSEYALNLKRKLFKPCILHFYDLELSHKSLVRKNCILFLTWNPLKSVRLIAKEDATVESSSHAALLRNKKAFFFCSYASIYWLLFCRGLKEQKWFNIRFCSGSQSNKPLDCDHSACQVSCIMESFRLEKTFKITSNHSPNTTKSTNKPCYQEPHPHTS